MSRLNDIYEDVPIILTLVPSSMTGYTATVDTIVPRNQRRNIEKMVNEEYTIHWNHLSTTD